MAQMSVMNLSKSYGIEEILRGISFQVEDKDRIGIIGNNGSGKTTLFNLISGEEEADTGSVRIRNGLRLGYLKQNIHIEAEHSLYEECLEAFEETFRMKAELEKMEAEMEELSEEPEELKRLEQITIHYHDLLEDYEEAGGYSYQSQIKGMLKGMGFTEEEFEQSVNSLSGGEKSRLELAKMLLERPDILLLDEPTNHLDIGAIQFLETFLQGFPGAILVISHDRYFLDRVVNRIFLIEHQVLKQYNTGYTEYMRRRKKDLEVMQAAYQNQQKEIERQKEIIERFANLGGSKRKRGIAQSRSRQKLLDKMVLLPEPPTEQKQMGLRFTPKVESGEDVLKVRELSKSFGDKELFEDVSFDIYRKEKIGLIGANGVGKTTLFKILLQKIPPDEGEVYFGTSVFPAYFDQEQQNLNNENTVLDEVWDAYPKLTHFEVRSYLARFLFTGDDIFKFIGDLSGGEKAKISLLKLMLSSANFLLMDEPTNHLDIDSKERLEDALLDYDGTCLMISHDRYFLNRVADRLFVLEPDGIKEYLGNYDYYVEKKKQEQEQDPEETITKTERRKEQKKKTKSQEEERKRRAAIRKVEAEITEMEEELEALKKKAYDPTLYEDHEKALELHEHISSLEKKKEEKEDEWFLLQESND